MPKKVTYIPAQGTNCESVLGTPAVSTEAIPPSDTPPTMNDDIRQRPTPSQSGSTSPPTQAATSSHTTSIPPSNTSPTMNDDIRQRPTPSQSDSTSPPTQAATSSHTTSTNPRSDVATSTDDEPASEMQNSTDISGINPVAKNRFHGQIIIIFLQRCE